MGNALCSCLNKKTDTDVDDTNTVKDSINADIKFSKTNFIVHDRDNGSKFKEDYLVGQSLGSSHFGEVRKCRHIQTNQVRAVKIIRKDKIDKVSLAQFYHEIEVLKRLDHPNIIKIYELYDDDKRLYLIMECCAGGELYDKLSNDG